MKKMIGPIRLSTWNAQGHRGWSIAWVRPRLIANWEFWYERR